MYELTEYDGQGCCGQRLVSESHLAGMVSGGRRVLFMEFAAVGRLTTVVLESGAMLDVIGFAYRVS